MTSEESDRTLEEIAEMVIPRIEESWEWTRVDVQVESVSIRSRALAAAFRVAPVNPGAVGCSEHTLCPDDPRYCRGVLRFVHNVLSLNYIFL